MNRSSSSTRSIKNLKIAMSYPSLYRPRGSQNQRHAEVVTGNSHEWNVRAINPHSHQGGRGGFPNQIEAYALPVNPRPHFNQNHVFYHRPYFNPQQHFIQNQNFIFQPLSQQNQPIYLPQPYRSQPPHLGVVPGDSHNKSVRDVNMRLQQGGNGGFSNENRFYGPPIHHTSPVNQYQSFQYGSHFDPNSGTQFQQNQPNYQPRPYKPPQRPSEFIHRDWEYAIQGPPIHCERFIVLSYNLLADYLAINHRDQLYNHIPSHMMDWHWRKRNILFELGWWSADIMCFQEVDRFGELENELKLCGYSGIWKMRTGEAVDGCAIFWRGSRFKLLHEECIEFSKLGLRNNVAQICVLESLRQDNIGTLPTSSTGSNKIVVCNIHVLYNPKRGEIKLGQVRNLLDKAHAVSMIWDNSPIVVCGDFNCTPKSPLYNYLSEQKLDLTDLARDKVSGQASCTIRPPRRFFTNQGLADIPVSPQNVINGHEYRAKQSDLFSGMQKKNVADELDKSGTDMQYVTESNIPSSDQTEKCYHQQGAEVSYKIEPEKTSSASVDRMEESPSNSHCEYGSPIDTLTGENCRSNASIISDHTEIGSDTLDIERKENANASSDDDDELSCKDTESNPPQESGSMNCDKDTLEKSDIVERENIKEDSQQGHTVESEMLPEMNFVPVDVARTYYDRSSWSPVEIETATGRADCVLVEHPLKLQSTYTEVEGLSKTRDLNGEPQVTSYNNCFLGTVDYIWRSEGLQTVRTLAPIPKHAMQWTRGFPSKKWGSDHIALATELAFVQDTTYGSTEPQ